MRTGEVKSNKPPRCCGPISLTPGPSPPWRAASVLARNLEAGGAAAFGVGVIGYLQDQRLQAARTLLIEQGVSVTEAALQVGYVNLSHFARLHRRAFGVCPRQAARADALEM